MRAVRTFVLAALMATTGWTSSRAAERVDLLLVLAADILRSVDEVKFQLQRSGYAAAFSDLRVIEAIRTPERPHCRGVRRMVWPLVTEDCDRLDGDQ